MTIQIDLPPDAKSRLEAQAPRLGLETTAYVKKLIEENLPHSNPEPGSLGKLFAEWRRRTPQTTRWRSSAETARRRSSCGTLRGTTSKWRGRTPEGNGHLGARLHPVGLSRSEATRFC